MSRTSTVNRAAKIAAATVLATVTALGALIIDAGTANATSAPIHLTDTVNIRSTPDTSRPPLAAIPRGASPDFHCFTYGQNINGVNVWFNVTWNGATGYYASYYDDSHYSSEADLTAKYGVGRCGSAPTPTPAPSRADQAIGWMSARMGSTAYDGLCLSAVYHAYLAAGVNVTAGLPYAQSHDTAYSFWSVARNRHPGDHNPPRGALVFFRSYAGAPGHVAISLGSGQMISTYDGRTHGIHTMAVSAYDQRLYLGWAGI